MPILLSFRDVTQDKYTDDSHNDCYRRLLHLQCTSLIIDNISEMVQGRDIRTRKTNKKIMCVLLNGTIASYLE